MSLPVLQSRDWLGEDCIARRVVDTEKQWLVFCYDEIENKNDDLLKLLLFLLCSHQN